MYNTQSPTEIYKFHATGHIVDGEHFWEPHDRYDFIVPLHHFTVDVGGYRHELEYEVKMAMRNMTPVYSDNTGERIDPLSEVFTSKGCLYFSTRYRPYIVKNEFQLKEGSDLRCREVNIHGHLEFDESILYARCDQIEFIPFPYEFIST